MSKLREMRGERTMRADTSRAAQAIAEFLSARRFELPWRPSSAGRCRKAIAVLDPAAWQSAEPWVQALAPLRFSRGDAQLLALGSRAGGRRYLSEDIEVLERLAAIVCEQVERMRNSEMQALVSQAELRALQAQINPHFLFNALNTLYGTIARENASARHLVLNLAGLFRYSFAQNRGLIRIAEELEIVRAYLEIEQLRLGSKLHTEIDVDDDALQTEVPVLSIQPLVENAVKHGVGAAQARRICAAVGPERRRKRSRSRSPTPALFRRTCRRRGAKAWAWRTCAGGWRSATATKANLEISSANDVTVVRFRLPCARVAQRVRSLVQSVHPNDDGRSSAPMCWRCLCARRGNVARVQTLIVDDEPVARQVLREELEQLDEIALIGEAEDGLSALAAIRDSSPDLVFLDLQMPGMGGFDVIRKLQPRRAHSDDRDRDGVGPVCDSGVRSGRDRLSAEADRSGAAGAGGGPGDETARVRPRVAEQLANIKEIAELPRRQPVRRIVARSGDEYLLLNADEVLAFEADGDLVWIITAKKRYLATQSLKVIQDKLRKTNFRRIHRKALVNIDHVRKMSSLSSQRWLLTLANSQEFIVSKRQAHTVRQLLSW